MKTKPFNVESSAKLIDSLKASLKEANFKIAEKDQEISCLKKNIKLTQINEIETESKTYLEECIRLSHLFKVFSEQKKIDQSAEIVT